MHWRNFTTTVLAMGVAILFLLPKRTFAQSDSCYSFDGIDDQVSIPYIPSYTIGTDFTVEALFRADSNQFQFATILSNRRNSSAGTFFGIQNRPGLEGWMFMHTGNTMGNLPLPSGVNVFDNQFHHIALTSEAYFIDGVKEGNLSGSVPFNENKFLAIGRDKISTGNTEFNGEIKEVRLWDHDRDSVQINQYKDTLLLGNELGLVGYWRLDETEGDIAYDYSPNQNHGHRGLDSAEVDESDPGLLGHCLYLAQRSNVSINTMDDTIICPGTSVVLSGLGDSSYFWINLSDSSLEWSDDIIVEPISTTSYVLLGQNQGRDTITITVKDTIDCQEDFVVYNVITPDGDGNNDFFIVKGIEFYPGNKLTIFDPSGSMIREFDTYVNNWSPTGLNSGVYYYHLEYGGKTETGAFLIKI